MLYSETSLKRTLAGQKHLSALERCPLWRGCAMRVSLRIGASGTNDNVRLREVSALEDVRFREVSLYLITQSSKIEFKNSE